MLSMTFGFLILGIAALIYWLVWLRFEEYTTDAYVNGNMVIVTPQVSGIVTSITADNTDFVTTGRLLVTLDTTDIKLAFERSKAELANTIRNVEELFQRAEQYKAEIDIKEAELTKAWDDFQNRVELVPIGGVSQEEFEHVEAALLAAFSSLVLSEHKYLGALAQVENTTVESHPLVEKAKDALRDSWVQLQRCNISAPVTGILDQRRVQVGEWVKKEDNLLAIIPLEQIWVDANFKETQLKNVRLGQSVKLKADIYGRSVHYHGKVIGFSGGTGSVFSYLPPQNATGNWIKIVQRLAVRIGLDPREVREHPLRLGLSMDVTVDTHNRDGKVIPKEKVEKPIYETGIFKTQEIGAEEIIQQILKDNIMVRPLSEES